MWLYIKNFANHVENCLFFKPLFYETNVLEKNYYYLTLNINNNQSSIVNVFYIHYK